VQRADSVITNGRVVTPGGIVEGGLAMSGEQIVAIGPTSKLPTAPDIYDARGGWILPGGVDTHVHIHYDSEFWRGDFGTESAAAVLGGTTTLAEFFHGGKPGLLDSFAAKKAAGEQLSVADFGLHAVFRAEVDLDLIEPILGAGVLSFKAMMADPNGIKPIHDGLLVELFEEVRRAGGMITVHAENEEINALQRRRFKAQGRALPLDHALSRPEISEGEGVSRAILFAGQAGVALHVFHLSSELGALLIARAQDRGEQVTAETCPQYLLFTQEDIVGDLGPFLQVNPSLKVAKDRDALWQALQAGTVDAVVSDHYAPTRTEKELGWTDIWKVEGGVPGIESRLAVLWQSGVQAGRISPQRFAELTATRPAQIFGLYPRKGALEVGADGDVVVWDPSVAWTIGVDTLHQTADWTPFAGLEIQGYPVMVFLRGSLVARGGELLAQPGSGTFIGRQC
jgi:D-hydantoinase